MRIVIQSIYKLDLRVISSAEVQKDCEKCKITFLTFDKNKFTVRRFSETPISMIGKTVQNIIPELSFG